MARRSSGKKMEKKTFATQYPIEEAIVLENIIDQRGQTKSTFMKDAIKFHLDNGSNMPEVKASMIGLITCLEGVKDKLTEEEYHEINRHISNLMNSV